MEQDLQIPGGRVFQGEGRTSVKALNMFMLRVSKKLVCWDIMSARLVKHEFRAVMTAEGQRTQDFVSHVTALGIYFKRDGNPLKEFEEKSYLTSLNFWKVTLGAM